MVETWNRRTPAAKRMVVSKEVHAVTAEQVSTTVHDSRTIEWDNQTPIELTSVVKYQQLQSIRMAPWSTAS